VKHSRLRLCTFLASAFALGGCIAAGPAAPAAPASQVIRPYPDGCAHFKFSARRCAAIVAIAREQLGIDDPGATVELLSEPPMNGCGPRPDGTVILCTRSGGGIPVIVRITPPDGPAEESMFHCGVGTQGSIACHDQPTVEIATPMEGYRDIACAGEDANGTPTGCATPVPTIQPEAAAAARPLVIEAREIPLDHDGAYAVDLGDVGIPNGVLRATRAALQDETIPDIVFLDGIRLTVEPVDPSGRPFINGYEHGWVPGVEDARVVLRFHVIQHEPGAILHLRDVEVR
jgi:hypothetical protein